jgi:hypothetical protein
VFLGQVKHHMPGTFRVVLEFYRMLALIGMYYHRMKEVVCDMLRGGKEEGWKWVGHLSPM